MMITKETEDEMDIGRGYWIFVMDYGMIEVFEERER